MWCCLSPELVISATLQEYFIRSFISHRLIPAQESLSPFNCAHLTRNHARQAAEALHACVGMGTVTERSVSDRAVRVLYHEPHSCSVAQVCSTDTQDVRNPSVQKIRVLQVMLLKSTFFSSDLWTFSGNQHFIQSQDNNTTSYKLQKVIFCDCVRNTSSLQKI
jgi:hypothetical protein